MVTQSSQVKYGEILLYQIQLWECIPMPISLSLIEPNPILMLELLVSDFDNLVVVYNFHFLGHIDHGKTTLTAAITKYLSTKGN